LSRSFSDHHPEVRNTALIRMLNDTFRTTFIGGRVTMTAGVNALSETAKTQVLDAVRQFDSFAPGNDPHEEHDFGAFEIENENYFWKIDYYDKSLKHGSDDPADPEKTSRVLTIMRSDEY